MLLEANSSAPKFGKDSFWKHESVCFVKGMISHMKQQLAEERGNFQPCTKWKGEDSSNHSPRDCETDEASKGS